MAAINGFPPELIAAHKRRQEAVDGYDKFLSADPLPAHGNPPAWDEAARAAHLAAAKELDKAYDTVATVRRKLGVPPMTANHDADADQS